MKNKILLDVNILLDFFLRRNDKDENVELLFQLLDDDKIEGYLTISIIQTCIYFLEKGQGLENTKRIVQVLLERFKLLEGDKKHVFQAIQSNHQDLEDAIHYFIALDKGIDTIVTNDQSFLKLSSSILPILTPKDFVANISPLNTPRTNWENVVVHSKADYERMQETFYLLKSHNAERLLKGLKDFEEGQGELK